MYVRNDAQDERDLKRAARVFRKAPRVRTGRNACVKCLLMFKLTITGIKSGIRMWRGV